MRDYAVGRRELSKVSIDSLQISFGVYRHREERVLKLDKTR